MHDEGEGEYMMVARGCGCWSRARGLTCALEGAHDSRLHEHLEVVRRGGGPPPAVCTAAAAPTATLRVKAATDRVQRDEKCRGMAVLGGEGGG